MVGRRWRYVASAFVISAVLVLSVAGCSGSGYSGTGTGNAPAGAASGAGTIIEDNKQFTPSTLTVKVGDKVTFSNRDSVPHDVVIGATDLGVQQPNQDVTWTAAQDGTFPFKCTIHPSMTGQVTVGTGGGGAAAPPAGTTGGAGGTMMPGSGGGKSNPGAPTGGGSGGYGY